MNKIRSDNLTKFLIACHEKNATKIVAILEESIFEHEIIPLSLAMLRIAIQQASQSPLYYRQLTNFWQRLNCPSLKPNPIASSLLIIGDSTLNATRPMLELFSSVYGINLKVRLSEYDSVEQQLLSPDNSLKITESDIVVLMLSEQWLKRHLSSTTIIEKEKLLILKMLLKTMFDKLQQRKPAKILVGNFPSRAFIGPGGTIVNHNYLGWTQAVVHLNDWLGSQVNESLAILDIAEAISLAGGSRALGRLSYLRAHIPFEEIGMLSVCREIAAVIANILGKSHRALLTDWDNTLWGGEIGELGLDVNSNVDNADGLGFQLVQQYILDLNKLGILIAAVSRNDFSVTTILDKNKNILLKIDNFASLAIHRGSKSQSVSKVVQDFSFGAEFMVFMDDSLLEIAEVLLHHPYIDIVIAGPSPDITLTHLCEARYFSTAAVSESDLKRHQRQLVIKLQQESRNLFNTAEDFLKSLNISLTISDLTNLNEMRVVQMLQKTNQFNLTSRRHQLNDIRKLKEQNARFGVFAYSDNFGYQGIISVVILLKQKNELIIESWVMSCRVLNRGVENAILNWIIRQEESERIVGEYFPTQKNELVKDLYPRLGFHEIMSAQYERRGLWVLNIKEKLYPLSSIGIVQSREI